MTKDPPSYTLAGMISRYPIEELRVLYQRAIEDFSDSDFNARRAARRVLTEFEVEGDSYGVPGLEDIVERLVAKIEELQKQP